MGGLKALADMSAKIIFDIRDFFGGSPHISFWFKNTVWIFSPLRLEPRCKPLFMPFQIINIWYRNIFIYIYVRTFMYHVCSMKKMAFVIMSEWLDILFSVETEVSNFQWLLFNIMLQKKWTFDLRISGKLHYL